MIGYQHAIFSWACKHPLGVHQSSTSLLCLRYSQTLVFALLEASAPHAIYCPHGQQALVHVADMEATMYARQKPPSCQEQFRWCSNMLSIGSACELCMTYTIELLKSAGRLPHHAIAHDIAHLRWLQVAHHNNPAVAHLLERHKLHQAAHHLRPRPCPRSHTQ